MSNAEPATSSIFKNLQKAIRLEKKGKFNSALKVYQNIAGNNLPDKENLYVKRSIGACLYYLKEYDKALQEFAAILVDFSIDTDLKQQIEENMQLCFLYGISAQRGIDFFKNRIENAKLESERECWWYWYVGQGCQLMKKYDEAELSYKNAYKIAKDSNSAKAGFFLLYQAVISMIRKHFCEAEKALLEYENLYSKNDNNGLFYILNGLLIMNENQAEGKKLYNKGIKKAKKEKWLENITLGNELRKSL